MKKILFALLTTVSGVVLLFSYRTSTEAVQPTSEAATSTESAAGSSTGTGSATSSPTATSTSDASGSSSTSTGSTSSTSSTGLQDGTYTGASVSTRFGPVQVQITVSGGQITAAQATSYPMSNGRDQEINRYAIPILQQETISAGSASIDMVSGATYTSRGYIGSLQDALDQAQA